MTDDDVNLNTIDPVERLICRSLDGELSATEQVEMDAILVRDPAARAVFDDYLRDDRAASAALRWDIAGAGTAVVARASRGLWLATAGAVLAAAAVVALSFLPNLWPANPPQAARRDRPTPTLAPSFVDYRDTHDGPLQRCRDLNRDVIGIPGRDGKTIYIFERNVQSTRVAPISGDF